MMQDVELPFPADTTEAWRARVERELQGKSYDDHLIWKNLDGFSIESWQATRPQNKPVPPRINEAWKILEPIYEADAQAANKEALDALNAGAEGIWFQKGFQGAAAEVAVNDIDQDIAPVFIHGTSIHDPFYKLLQMDGAVEVTDEGLFSLNGIPFRERGATLLTETALLISMGHHMLQLGVSPDRLVFRTAIGSGFLSEIAKLRSLRWLWSSLLETLGKEAHSPVIIGSNLTHHYPQTDEHTNILRATSSAMAGVIGGCSYILIEPWNKHWDGTSKQSKRISRNIQVLLKEEARMDKNLNPADGSYFIEQLTTKMSEAIWEKVQAIDAKDGFESYARSGELKEAIMKERGALIKAYQSNEKTLLGINKFPPSSMATEEAPSKKSYALLPDYCYLPQLIQA